MRLIFFVGLVIKEGITVRLRYFYVRGFSQVFFGLLLSCFASVAAAKGSCSVNSAVLKPIKGISLGMAEESLEQTGTSFEKSAWLNSTTRYHEDNYSHGTMMDVFVVNGRVVQISLWFEDYYPNNIAEFAASLHNQYGFPSSGWRLPKGEKKENSKYKGETICADFTVYYSTGRDDVAKKVDPAKFALIKNK